MREAEREQPIQVREIGRLRVEEFASGYRIVAPRKLLWEIFVIGLVFTGIVAILPRDNGPGPLRVLIFYGSFAIWANLFRLTQRHVVLLTASEIVVRHENFGICWWKSRYPVEPACELAWSKARRRRYSAVELSCGGRVARFAYDITQAEAAELLPLIHQKFGHMVPAFVPSPYR
jgi:hypothetical protein